MERFKIATVQMNALKDDRYIEDMQKSYRTQLWQHGARRAVAPIAAGGTGASGGGGTACIQELGGRVRPARACFTRAR